MSNDPSARPISAAPASPTAPPRDRVAWINGDLWRESRAASSPGVSPFDHGLLTGDGIFETIRVYRGRPFALDRHLARLALSAERMGLDVPHDLRDACRVTIEENAITEGRLRITVTGGPAPLGSGQGSGGPTCLLAAEPVGHWPPSTAVVTVPWPRNERGALAGVKSTSYGENVVAWARAVSQGAGEAILPNTVGNLCEGTGSNIFLVIDDTLITPTLSSGCLAGVTRDLVIELTGAETRDVPIAALAGASEAFLTSTTREVQPIHSVDGVPLTSAPGPHSARAAQLFAELLERTDNP